MTRMVDFAREHDVLLVHDFAYADLGFDGYDPPSILQVPGAKDVAVELYTLTKSFSMAGWRVGFLLGNAEVVGALAKLKSYLDYGTFQPIQIAATVAMNEAPDYPKEVNEIYRGRRDALDRRAGAHRLGDREAQGHDVRVGADPRAVRGAGQPRVRQDAGAGGQGRGVARRRASAPAARASCASRWSRTSSASARPSAASAAPSPSSADAQSVLRVAQLRERSTPRCHCRLRRRSRSGSGGRRERGVLAPARSPRRPATPTRLRRCRRGTRRRARWSPHRRPAHGHAEHVGLELAQQVHHARAAVDAQLGRPRCRSRR